MKRVLLLALVISCSQESRNQNTQSTVNPAQTNLQEVLLFNSFSVYKQYKQAKGSLKGETEHILLTLLESSNEGSDEHIKIIEDLLKDQNEQIDINLQDKRGFSAIYVAVLQNDINALKVLLQYGANPNTVLGTKTHQNYEGKTLLMIAFEEGYPETAEVLIKNENTSYQLQDEEGRDSLDYAIMYPNQASFSLLESHKNLIQPKHNERIRRIKNQEIKSRFNNLLPSTYSKKI